MQCQGVGLVNETYLAKFALDRGMDSAAELTLAGKGSAARDRDPGDLIIVLKQEPHPVFKVN